MTENRIWNVSLDSLLGELGTARCGLTGPDAARRLSQFGPKNTLHQRRRPLAQQILDRFANPLVLIFLFASALSAWTGEVASCIIISVIIFLSVVLDVFQQWRAENAVETLRRSVELKARAVRDGVDLALPIEQIVPGDVVHLQAGDIVPADCRLLAARDLFVNQALLTGEPYPVERHAKLGAGAYIGSMR